MGVQRFAVEGLNVIQPLTAEGADVGGMGLKAFQPAQPAVSNPQPAMEVGGMKL